MLNSLNLEAPTNNLKFTGTVRGITKEIVNLANVHDTSDLAKPISIATQSALNLKPNSSDIYTKGQVDTSLALKSRYINNLH